MADQLLGASEALESGEPQEALQKFQEIEALDGDLSSDVAFLYGKTLVEYGISVEDWRKGRSLLAEVGWGSAHYTRALEMLLAVENKMDAVERYARLEERTAEIK